MFTTIATIVGAVAILVILFLATYKVVGTDEAHVIVFMGRGRSIKTPVVDEAGKKGNTAYFYVPLIMKRYVMPLTNVKLEVPDIGLNDVQVAPFVCDVVTWLHIKDPIKASERLDFHSGNIFKSLHADLVAIVQAVSRTTAMKQEILDIMRDRATFAEGVSTEVNGVLDSWGVQLVNLEVNDIRDQGQSHVIADYEAMRKAQVNSKARIEIAARDREAVEQEQENRKLAEVATAVAEKEFQVKQIERDKVVGIERQNQIQDVAKAEQIANKQKIEALRETQVGQADVQKQETIRIAEGDAQAVFVKGEKEADVVRVTGTAEGDAIKAKGLAEAEAKLKMAEALQKYNDAATGIEKIFAVRDIQIAFAQAYGKMAENADIKVVTSGEGGNLFGLPLNAQTGGDLGQMIEAMGADKIADLIDKAIRKPEDE